MESLLEIVPHVDVRSLIAGAWSVLIDGSIKATVVLLVTAVATWALGRRASAATRYSIWRLAVLAVLVVPVVSALLPAWNVEWLPAPRAVDVNAPRATLGRSVAVPASESPADITTGSSQPIAGEAGRASTIASAARPAPAVPRPMEFAVHGERVSSAIGRMRDDPAGAHGWYTGIGVVLMLWWLGASVLVAMLVAGLVYISRITRAAHPVSDPSFRQLMAAIVARSNIRRPIAILLSPGAVMPMTWGVRRPLVLLPESAVAWTRDRLVAVLRHELAHIKRHDYLMQLVTRYACAVYWFHPLMWLAARRMRLERERACDDEVLSAGSKPSAYAGHLLAIAQSLRPTFAGFAGMAMARPSHLADRLDAVLNSTCKRTPSSRLARVTTWVIAASFVIPLACVRSATASPEVAPPRVQDLPEAGPVMAAAVSGVSVSSAVSARGAATALPSGRAAAWPIADAARPRGQVTTWASAPRCAEVDRREGRRGSQQNVNDDRQTVRWWDGDCEGEMRSRGSVEFNRDFTDVVSISSGGSFSLQIDDGDVERRVELRADRDGSLERRWFDDGRERAYDDASREWFALALRDLFLHSSFKIDERVAYILEEQGVDGLIRQADASHGSYLKRRFFTAAIETGMLGSQQIGQLLERGAVGVDSDHELSRLLMSVPADAMRDESLRRTYVRVAGEIGSDFEKRRVLSAMLAQEDLADDLVVQLLGVAGAMESDFELARLLRDVGPVYLTNDNVRAAYLTTANGVESDFERRRVLDALLHQEGLSSDILVALLNSASSIESDHELSRILTGVAQRYLIEESLRAEFFRAVGSVDSDFERAGILRSVVQSGEASPDVLNAVLESARQMTSDHELARLLREVSEAHGVDDEFADAFFAGVAAIGSDFERERVLAGLARGNVNRSLVLRIVDAARAIEGDNAKANVLLVVAREHGRDEGVRDALLSALETIESDHDYARVMRVLRR